MGEGIDGELGNDAKIVRNASVDVGTARPGSMTAAFDSKLNIRIILFARIVDHIDGGSNILGRRGLDKALGSKGRFLN